MRRFPSILCALGLLLAACGGSTEPEIFAIAGTWRSTSLADVQIEMTLVETARAVTGSGHWTTPTSSTAFRATGASVGTSASILMDFDMREDVNFTGRFERESGVTRLVGSLNGGGFRAQGITFQLEEEADD